MRREEINEWFDLHRQNFGQSDFMDKLRELAMHGLEAEAKLARPEAGATNESKLRRLMDEVRANGHMMSNGEILDLCAGWLWLPPSKRYQLEPQSEQSK